MDDTKLIRGVKSLEEVEEMQLDLESLYKWQVESNMQWNGSKFVALRMGNCPHIWEDSVLLTPNMEEPIEVKEVAKDLGILMDSKGNFRPQRTAAAAKASAKAGWVLRTFQTREIVPLRMLWCSLVRPHQDYASQLWAPVGLMGDLRAQEAPLRAFTKRMRGLKDLQYWERLEACGLSSMERRQDRYRIIYT